MGSSASKRSNYSRSFEFQDDSREFDCDDVVGGAMLPIFLNDLRRNGTGAYSHGQRGEDLVEVTLEVDDDDSILLCSVAPATGAGGGGGGDDGSGFLSRTASSLRRKLCRLKSLRSRASSSSDVGEATASSAVAAAAGDKRGEMKMKAKLMRTKSSAQRALGGLRFISKTTKDTDMNEVWRGVESRFNSLAQNGFLSREDFGECIGKEV